MNFDLDFDRIRYGTLTKNTDKKCLIILLHTSVAIGQQQGGFSN